MVELIVVMVLIGIISTIAISRFFERTSFDTVAWTDQVRSMLRYGQKIAIAQNRPVFVLLQADRVALCFQADAACPTAQQVAAPGGANNDTSATATLCAQPSWMCAGRPDDVRMAVPGAWIAFDALGRASAPGAGAQQITISGDDVQRTLTVELETGYVD
jgi:MSHA pilin protein MshC